jgi:hypothetical protein
MLPDGRSWQEVVGVTDLDVLVCAGRPIRDYSDRIRRYCGLPWSGGPPETWAFRYFDGVASRCGDAIEPTDVLACTALHSGLTHRDLIFFFEQARLLETWLSELPTDVDLADADASTVAHVASLPRLTDDVGLSLLVPLFDRAISDWYRPVTGVRGVAGWQSLVGAVREDLGREKNRQVLTDLRSVMASELPGGVPSDLRLADIAIWMTSARS